MLYVINLTNLLVYFSLFLFMYNSLGGKLENKNRLKKIEF